MIRESKIKGITMSEKYLSPTDYLLTNVNGQVLTITLKDQMH